MPRWGDFIFSPSVKFGTTGLTADEQDAFDVFAGESPALPGRTVPVRSGCAEIVRWNPTTWTAGAALPYIAAGATRQATLAGVGFQQETLTFQISNAAAYYADPLLMDLVEPGAWIAVSWTVATPTADVAVLGGVFRVVSGASRERLAGPGASTFTVQCVDWAQIALGLQSGGGWITYPDWDAARLAYIAAGGKQLRSRNPGSTSTATTWGTLAAALLVTLLGFGTKALIAFDADTWAPVPNATGGEALAFLQVGDPGKPTSAYDWFTWLWPYLGGFYLGYRSETGKLMFIPGGNTGVDSGYYLTTETTALGSTPLPWTTPLLRQLSRPECTKVEYHFKGTVGNTPSAAGSVASAELVDDSFLRGQAVSDHPEFPFDGTLNSTLKIVEQGTVQQALGFATFTDFARWRLRNALGAADTLTLSVDPACPPPPLSTVVRVRALPDVDGWYRLVGFTQPLGAALAAWQLEWWGTA